MGKKIGIAVVVVVVVVVGAAFYWSMNAPRTEAPSAPVADGVEPSPAPVVAQVIADADADPDAIADAVLAAELDSEVTHEEADPTLTTSDESLTNEFDQSLHSSQF